MGREFWRCSLGAYFLLNRLLSKTVPGEGMLLHLGPPPQLCPNLTQSVNGPESPVAVGFGEAWRQVGTLFRRRREGCQ